MAETHTLYSIARKNESGGFELVMNGDVLIEYHEKDAIEELKIAAVKYGQNSVMLLSRIPVSFNVEVEIGQSK